MISPGRCGRRLPGPLRLPRGPGDLTRQLLLFAGAYGLYQLVRGLAGTRDAARAQLNAVSVIDLERSLHVFVEPRVEAWAVARPWLIDLAGGTYVNAHVLVTVGALAFIYLRRNESFYFVRNMFMVAMLISLIGYAVYPTAPPRLMPAWGFSDVIEQFTGISAEHGAAGLLVNPYAAIPSMHVCCAAMVGWAMARLSDRPAARLAWRAYPVLISFVVVATGNHYLTDVALGAATAAVSALLARVLLARARPDAWAFGQAAA